MRTLQPKPVHGGKDLGTEFQTARIEKGFTIQRGILDPAMSSIGLDRVWVMTGFPPLESGPREGVGKEG